MKLALAASGLFVALMSVGIACGPTETFCYKEGKTCREVKAEIDNMNMQSDASDAMDATGLCFDEKGNTIPCG
ncbi:MAG TPA: hypothetical protein VIU64_07465 [Polyangia bacterium]